jgi:L-lysine 2,3-aminomutase
MLRIVKRELAFKVQLIASSASVAVLLAVSRVLCVFCVFCPRLRCVYDEEAALGAFEGAR